MTMNLHATPAFSDRCLWTPGNGCAALLDDRRQAAPLLAALAPRGVKPAGILVTPPGHTAGDLDCGRAEGASNDSPLAEFAALREWKNRHR